MLKIISSELVVPSEETPKAPIWLSNLDLVARRGYTAMVYFYRPPNDSAKHDFLSANSLKSSLAKALVPFYPLSGRLSPNQDDRVEISCTGEEGALFVAAQCDALLDDFDCFSPSDEMRNMFVPPTEQQDPRNSMLLMVQVTFFKCGGVALGTALHHMLVDASSGFHFMETWSSIARGQAGCPVLPSFDHSPLTARPDPKILYDHLEYKSNTNGMPSGMATSYESCVLKISKKEIDALKLRCGDTTGARVSTFRAITAVVWRCICLARKLDASLESRLYTMIDMRNRMCPPLPRTYFGNAVIRTSVSAVVGDIISSPINTVARRILGATQQGDDFARSLIDYLETVNTGNLPRSSLSKFDLRVISWLGMPQNNADFGWGQPIFCGPAMMYYRGFVSLMNTPGKDAGVTIVVALEPENLPRFKELFFEELAILHA